MKLQAHRGVALRYPENTMAAFRASVEEGYDLIELDMEFTKDNRCVILHDSTLNRTARKKDCSLLAQTVKIADLTYGELSEYDVGLHKGEAFRGEPIPALEEVLRFSFDNNVKLKFDNKLQNFDGKQQNIFFDEVSKFYKDGTIGFTANSLDFIQKVVSRFPGCDIHYDGPIREEMLEQVASAIKENTLYIWLPIQKMSWLPYPPADKDQMALAMKYGKTGLWIATDPGQLPHCRELGADVVETDGAITPAMVK